MKMNNKDVKAVNVSMSLSPDFKEILDAEAEKFHISRSQLVYELLNNAIMSGGMKKVYQDRIASC